MYYVVEVSTLNKPNILRFFTSFDEIIAFSVLCQSSVINTILIQRTEVKPINVGVEACHIYLLPAKVLNFD